MTARHWQRTSWGFTSVCPWPREIPDGLDPIRTQLVRWLVAQGRITEDLPCPCSRDPCQCVADDPAEIAHEVSELPLELKAPIKATT